MMGTLALEILESLPRNHIGIRRVIGRRRWCLLMTLQSFHVGNTCLRRPWKVHPRRWKHLAPHS